MVSRLPSDFFRPQDQGTSFFGGLRRPRPPQRILASEELHGILKNLASSYERDFERGGEVVGSRNRAAGSFDDHHEDHYYTTTTTTTTTTKPPIIWFPTDPDCGDAQAPDSASVNSFQLIAFLLSVFNLSAIFASNANSNNRNNNVNDNAVNGNENNENESNANAEVNAMNTIMMGGRELARRLLDLWNGAREVIATTNNNNNRGGRSVDEREKIKEDVMEDINSSMMDIYSTLESRSGNNNNCNNTFFSEAGLDLRYEAALSVTSMLNLWTRMFLANRRECLERIFCSANEEAARSGFTAWAIAEVGSLAILDRLPRPILGNRSQSRGLFLAGHYGRSGLDCEELYKGCGDAEWNLITRGSGWAWLDPLAEEDVLRRLMEWTINRERFAMPE